MCIPISPYSHITSCSKFHVLADPWARTTSLRSPCLLAPRYSLCPSLAAGSHVLFQPCYHPCSLSKSLLSDNPNVSHLSVFNFPLTFLLMPSVNTSQAGWRAEGRGPCGFHTCSQAGSTGSDLLLGVGRLQSWLDWNKTFPTWVLHD